MRELTPELIWTKIRIAAAAAGGAAACFLGGMDGLVIALITLMGLDYLSGVLCALAERKLSSAVGFRGIARKMFILMLVGIAGLLDRHVTGTGSALRAAVICFYLSNEALSLLENAARIGLPVPARLREALAQLHGGRTEPEGGEPHGEETERDPAD